MFKKSGQSRWDVTISWTALQSEGSEEVRYKQWIDLQNIVAIFKCAPFVEVESPHLRQILIGAAAMANETLAIPDYHRIGMALRQLQVSTHPDIVDALNVNLTMTYFNYAPYSVGFDYIGLTFDEHGNPNPGVSVLPATKSLARTRCGGPDSFILALLFQKRSVATQESPTHYRASLWLWVSSPQRPSAMPCYQIVTNGCWVSTSDRGPSAVSRLGGEYEIPT